MTRSTVSSCHSLKIIPLSRVSRFARIKSRVVMLILGARTTRWQCRAASRYRQPPITVYKKKITFERSDVSDITADALGGYKVSRLIATYVDESGKRRVAGSPDWPLSLDYSIGDGVFSVTLQGEDTAPDAFLMD